MEIAAIVGTTFLLVCVGIVWFIIDRHITRMMCRVDRMQQILRDIADDR